MDAIVGPAVRLDQALLGLVPCADLRSGDDGAEGVELLKVVSPAVVGTKIATIPLGSPRIVRFQLCEA